MEYVVMAGQLMLSLSILIVLHELGHFLPARLFGTRVEKFFLFFDVGGLSISKKIGETEYGIGWLPLGGYVKISGMIDESFDREQMAQEPQPWEFRSKPAWQRLIIMLGGVTVNFLLGFFLYGMVLWVWGEDFLPAENAKYGLSVDSLGMDMGLRDGDHILQIGDKPFDIFTDRAVVREIVINDASELKVRRNNQEVTLPIDEKFTGILSAYENKNQRLFYARRPFVAARLDEDGPGAKAGIKLDDEIIALNGESTPFFMDFYRKSKQLKHEKVVVTVVREQTDTIQLSMTTTEDGKIRVGPYDAAHFFEMEHKDYSLAQAMPAGVAKGWNFLVVQVKAFGQMFKGKIKPSESLGGFGSIGSMFGGEWDWERFWTMTAILSLILAFMNLLPIPALDGGHVMFLLYEVASGRKPSDKFMEYATIVGFVIVIGLVLYANGLDIIRAIF